MTFFVNDHSFTTAAELIADAVPVDRKIIIQEITGQSVIRFEETGDAVGVEPTGADFRFVLPAGVQLWMNASASSVTSRAQIIVTSIGRLCGYPIRCDRVCRIRYRVGASSAEDTRFPLWSSKPLHHNRHPSHVQV